MAYRSVAIRNKRFSSREPPASDDPDEDTDDRLLRDQKTLSKGRIRRIKALSTIVGNAQPTRKKIFSTVQLDTDYRLFSIEVHSKTISCVKVFNPMLLERNPDIWKSLTHVHRFELEDPEGTLTVIPRHYAANMEDLEAFSITWTRVRSLPSELFREGLRTLSLQRNHIKSLTGIEKAVSLSNLDVSCNLLTELPKTLGQLQNLTTLNISGNAIAELPVNIGCLTQLKTLDCSCNRLTVLPDCICNLIELSSLNVANNNLTELPKSIVGLPKLEDLQAQINQLEMLPDRFDRLNKLTTLNLRRNRFTKVPPQLSRMSSLQVLNMKDNIIRKFPDAVPCLKTLILDSNNLGLIPDALVECSNLQMLSIQNNKITALPTKIKNMASLRVLHLSRNGIEEVPEDIGALKCLRHLNLSATQIETLPNAILSMPELVKLDITDCPRLQSYLRLAYKEGGLVQLRQEMRQQAENEVDEAKTATNSPESMDCQENAEESPINATSGNECNNSDEVLKCKRTTIISFSRDSCLVDIAKESINLHTIPENTALDNLFDAASAENHSKITSDTDTDYCNTPVKMRRQGPTTRPKANKQPAISKLNDNSVVLQVFDPENKQERQSIRPNDSLTTSKRQSHV